MLKTIYADGTLEVNLLNSLRARSEENTNNIDKAVAEILKDIKQYGIEKVNEYSMKFDKTLPYEIKSEEIDRIASLCDEKVYKALEKASKNIESYHKEMLVKTWNFEREKGEKLGQIVRGLTRVGIYVPGGTAAYPSSVLMNAIPAKVAGVSEIIMVSPPTENLSPAVIAAAKIAGVDRVIAVGGAVAIAALSYSAGFIPKVDKIVGPGNAYVASAKKQVFGKVDIDMIAGPSEILVIADESANPKYIAADLLSQAEHDKLASAILLTNSEKLAKDVSCEIKRQLETLSRNEIIEESLENFGFAVVFKSIDDACEFANEVAPEHLEIVTKDPHNKLSKVKNAGAIFLGEYSPEPLGYYMAGPSHVLPTDNTARFFSPLSVDTFLKKTSVIEYSREALLNVADDIVLLADCEKLTAHANSIKVRIEK